MRPPSDLEGAFLFDRNVVPASHLEVPCSSYDTAVPSQVQRKHLVLTSAGIGRQTITTSIAVSFVFTNDLDPCLTYKLII